MRSARVLAFIVASRFGILFGLALWLGLVIALLVTLPLLARDLPAAQARPLERAVTTRLDALAFVAVALVLGGLAARVYLDRAAPPTSLVVPVAAMTLARLLSALALHRVRAARLAELRGPLLTLEVCLSMYALYAVS